MSRVCQIKASAGSGKTFTLTSRYLRLLARCLPGSVSSGTVAGMACAKNLSGESGAFGDILAITFTNAAVSEIRERVIRNLKEASLGLKKVRGVELDVATRCLDALLFDMSQLNVRTIDSLLHQIVRISALSLRLHPDFEPVFSNADAIEPYMDEFMRGALNGDTAAEDMLGRAIQGQLEYDQATATDEKARAFLPAKDILHGMEPFLQEVLCHPDGELADEAEARKTLAETRDLRQALALRLLAEIDGINASNPKPVAKLKKDPGQALAKFAAGGTGKAATLLGMELRDILVRGSTIKADLSVPEKTFRELREPVFMGLALQDYLRNASVISLARKLARDFHNGLPGGNKIPAALIPVLAQRALDFNEGICDALCRLGSRLTHFMLDEFQDTSSEQWCGLRPLVEDALSRGGSLTWVGDIKQSIFMWRNACPELFDGILSDRNLVDMVERTQRKRLPLNRRSSRVVVELNNRLFGRLEDKNYAARILEHMVPNRPYVLEKASERVALAFGGSVQGLPKQASDNGLVLLDGICIEKSAGASGYFLEAFEGKLLEFLAERKKLNLPYSDLMVLVRTNEDAVSIAAALTRHNFPVVTENSLRLRGNPLVEESIAFLRFLDNPEDDIALLTVLSGKIFSGHPAATRMAAEDVASLALGKENQSLRVYFQELYPEVWNEILRPFYEQAQLMTAYDAVREWYRRMAVEARFVSGRLFLRSFLELLRNAEVHGHASIADFLAYWHDKGGEAMAHMPEGVDAIKITTIHKSKGLEAPVVFVPLTAYAQKVKASQYTTLVNKKFGNLLLNVPLRKEYAREYDDALVRQSAEILDMLYVAFTRASRELYVYTPVINDTKPLLQVLAENAGLGFPYENGRLDLTRSTPATAGKSGDADKDMKALKVQFPDGGESQPWLSRLKIARSRLFSRAEHAERRGTFLHFCLENIRFTGNPAEDARHALDFGISHSGLEVDDAEALYDNLLWFISQPHTREWLEKGWPEQPMLDEHGREMRVDLLVGQPWGTLVLDYKTGSISEKNVEQMQAYLQCCEQSGLFPGDVCGLLVYMDQKKFRVVTASRVFKPVEKCPILPPAAD